MTPANSGPFPIDHVSEQASAVEARADGADASRSLAPPAASDSTRPPLGPSEPSPSRHQRYHIATQHAPDLVPLPPRFRVRVKKHRLIGLGLRELVTYRGNLPITLSRPCVYGVFSRPVGGLAPREELWVGCLRCTVQYPDIVQIHPNPERRRLGDSFVRPEYVDTILYEARTGRVPVRGAGYRGAFGGDGWDGLWTDMSEIVRPTRDGIHGREFISTSADIGAKPAYLRFDEQGTFSGPAPTVLTTQVPFVFDVPPGACEAEGLLDVLADTARQIETLAIIPLPSVIHAALTGPHIAPLIAPADWNLLGELCWSPRILMLEGWDRERYDALVARFPGAVIGVRVPMDADVLGLVWRGVRVISLTANYHGYVGDQFAMDLILRAHRRLVEAGVREEVTLHGSGGIVLAEHVPKAIICGLDVVGLDVALAVALQARFSGECRDRDTASLTFPRLARGWGVQRLKNLTASWRDQLLEVLGAMGLREVRRLRGEIGRCMFQRELEREAFGELEGYEHVVSEP